MNSIFYLTPTTMMWLGLLIIFVIAEVATAGLVTIWFAAGAVVALLLAALGCPVIFQIFVFLLVSGLTLLLMRPLAVKSAKKNKTPTNADRLIGQKAIVTEAISNFNHSGRAMIQGQDWSVQTEDDIPTLEVGTVVEVLGIRGAKLIVKKAEED